MLSEVAQRYAQALFELGEEEQSKKKYYLELKEISDVITSNKELCEVLKAPFIYKKDKKAILEEIFDDKIDKMLMNFLKILIDKYRIKCLPIIVDEYLNLINEAENKSDGVVITAIELDKTQLRELEANLSKKYKKTIKLKTKVDKSILGGVLVRIGNEEIDSTLVTRLANMKEILTQVIS